MKTANTILRILRAVNKADKEGKIKEQKIIEELKEMLDLTRIMIWELDYNIFYQNDVKCEIVAGVPFDEKEHGFGKIEAIENHKDLEHVFQENKIYIENDPTGSKLTNYFLPAIKQKNISQIVYIPFFDEGPNKKMRGIMVVDLIGERKLNKKEIKILQVVGETVTVMIVEREYSIQKTRDEIYQQIVSMETSLNIIKRHGFKMIGYASSIVGALENAPKPTQDIIKKFVDSGYKMMSFADNFLDAFGKMEKKIPKRKDKFNGKGK